jgi:hypothetical protein
VPGQEGSWLRDEARLALGEEFSLFLPGPVSAYQDVFVGIVLYLYQSYWNYGNQVI